MAGKAVEITDANFEETVLKSDKPVLIDFWAVWCGPCRAVAPIVEEIAGEYDGRALVGKLDVDSSRDTAVKYGIQAIPTLLLVKDGEVADRIVGIIDKNGIEHFEVFFGAALLNAVCVDVNWRLAPPEVEYIVKENEGHGFSNEENRFDFYREMEKFLAKHLGGRVEEPEATE